LEPPVSRSSRREFLTAAGALAAGATLGGCGVAQLQQPVPSSHLSSPPTASPALTATPGSTPSSQVSNRLPAELLLGYATAAYQIEGAVKEDGRGPSIWDTFCQRPGAIDDGSSGAVACDHYHRWAADVDLMARLRTQAYRFSIAWPRIFPAGVGRLNTRGLDFYQRLIDRLRAKGISPMATVYHWDLPQALQDRGGWQVRDCASWFADYAAVVFQRLTGVDRWVTINEPRVIVHSGHQIGTMAPGIRSDLATGKVIHHLALAHGMAVQAFRAAGSPGEIGLCCAATPCYPADDTDAALAQSELADAWRNRVYLDPVLRGRYPALRAKFTPKVRAGLDAVERPGDLQIANQPVDFVGVNYYTPTIVDRTGKTVVYYPTSSSGQQIYAQGLNDIVTAIHQDYGLPIVITENGIPDYPGRPAIDDGFRIGFLHDHLQALLGTVAAGVPVRGYYAWSLLDNFEWARGFTQRWGLVHTDYPTQRRTPKKSAAWYADVITSRRLSS
jgi:beta-glucosidase